MLVFPSNPNAGDVFAPGPGFPSWQWDGEKWTRTTGAGALATLSDVALDNLTQGQMLKWDAAIDKWVNTNPPPSTLAGLADVELLPPSDGQVLTWNNAAQKWLNAPLPAPITPTLAGLADTSFSSLAAGQALTFNGSAWGNSNTFSPIRITGATGLSSLAVNVASGQAAVDIWRDDTGTFIYGGDGSTGQQFRIEDIPTFVRFNVDNARMLLSTNGGSRLTIDEAGAVTVNPYNQSNTTALVVNGNDNQWAQVMQCGGASGHGLWVRAGTNSSTYCALFRNQTNDQNYFRLMGDGTGELGASGSNRLRWNTYGEWVLGRDFQTQPPAAPVCLWLKGVGDYHGLYLQAGSNALTGLVFGVWSENNANGYFSIRNDGLLSMLPGGAIKIFPFPVASGSAVFDVDCRNNTGGGNALRVWGSPNSNAVWLQGASNTAGVYHVLMVASPGVSSNSYGMKVQAGTNGNDYSITGRTAADSVIFEARGDRTFVLPGIPSAAPGTYQALQWWAGGFGSVIYTSSSIRYKRDVRSIRRNHAREILSKLRAVTFRQTAKEAPDLPCYGFVAEEVAEVDPSLAPLDAEGKPAGVSDERIVALLVPLMQELLGMSEPEEQQC